MNRGERSPIIKSLPRFYLFFLVILGILFIAFTVIAFTAHTDTVLRYSDHQPLDGMRTKFLEEVFFPAVERVSDGRIKFDKHWDGEVAIAYKALETLAKGEESDISTIVPEYTPTKLPLHQIFKSFPVGPSGADQVSLFRDIYSTISSFTQELDDNNIVPVFLSTGYPAGFFGTKPLEGIKDIKGQKWRSASFLHIDFIKNAGATPVKTHWSPEIYTALENGDLDGLLVNIDSAYNLKLHEKANKALVSKALWLGHLYIVAMNKDKYNSLSADDKEAIRRAAEYSYRQLGRVMDESYDKMVEILESEGTSVRTLTEEDVQSWATLSDFENVQSDWVAEQEEKGVEKAHEVIKRVRDFMNTYKEWRRAWKTGPLRAGKLRPLVSIK